MLLNDTSFFVEILFNFAAFKTLRRSNLLAIAPVSAKVMMEAVLR